jgi:hypothetical protein
MYFIKIRPKYDTIVVLGGWVGFGLTLIMYPLSEVKIKKGMMMYFFAVLRGPVLSFPNFTNICIVFGIFSGFGGVSPLNQPSCYW